MARRSLADHFLEEWKKPTGRFCGSLVHGGWPWHYVKGVRTNAQLLGTVDWQLSGRNMEAEVLFTTGNGTQKPFSFLKKRGVIKGSCTRQYLSLSALNPTCTKATTLQVPEPGDK
jgi:hypothetical protein